MGNSVIRSRWTSVQQIVSKKTGFREQTMPLFVKLAEGLYWRVWRSDHTRNFMRLVDNEGVRMPLSKTSVTCLLAGVLVLPIGVRTAGWLASSEQPVDMAMAESGRELFHHDWQPNDPLASGGDGLGPVFNEASCVACHRQAGPGGGGPNEHNVVAFSIRPTVVQRSPDAQRSESEVRQGVLHAQAISNVFREKPEHVDGRLKGLRINRINPGQQQSSPQLPSSMPECSPGGTTQLFAGIDVSQRNTPALFGARLIDEIPARLIIANERRQAVHSGLQPSDQEEFPVGRASRLPNGEVGRFGWKGQTASLAEFVQAACANEVGLGNPGSAQPAALSKPDYSPPGIDLTQQQCDEMTAFVASLARPIELLPDAPELRHPAVVGKEQFHAVGCADCHTPNIGDIVGIYSDLLLHRMGRELSGGGSYGDPPIPVSDEEPIDGPLADEWRTPPLWGVADSAPYLHDGRAATLADAIAGHRGQAARSVEKFNELTADKRQALIAFLGTLRAPGVEQLAE